MSAILILAGLLLAFAGGVVAGHRWSLYVRARNWLQDVGPRWPKE